MPISGKNSIFDAAFGGDLTAIKSAFEENKNLIKKKDEVILKA